MSDMVSWKTVSIAAILALLGVVFNTTRFHLTGAALGLWIVGSVVFAFLLTHGVQYYRINYGQ